MNGENENRETFGDYIFITWEKENDDKNVKHICDCIRELLKSARMALPDIDEESIYIVAKGGKDLKKLGFEKDYQVYANGGFSVGLRCSRMNAEEKE